MSGVVVMVAASVLIVVVMMRTMAVMMGFDQRAFSAVSAALGLEGANDAMDMAAEAGDHFSQDVIGLDVKCVRRYLAGRVAVADVPGDAGEFGGVVGVDLEEVFGGGTDDDDFPVVEFETVAVGEIGGFGQIKQEIHAVVGLKRNAAPEAGCAVEGDRRHDCGRCDLISGNMAKCSFHGAS